MSYKDHNLITMHLWVLLYWYFNNSEAEFCLPFTVYFLPIKVVTIFCHSILKHLKSHRHDSPWKINVTVFIFSSPACCFLTRKCTVCLLLTCCWSLPTQFLCVPMNHFPLLFSFLKLFKAFCQDLRIHQGAMSNQIPMLKGSTQDACKKYTTVYMPEEI